MAEAATHKFLKGTLILTLGSIVVKVIGSLNWVILSRIMGGEGIGLYQMGFPIYLLAITISSSGIPVAISIITAEYLAHSNYGGAKRVFTVSLRLLAVVGLLFSLAVYGGAEFLITHNFVRDARAYYSIVALAPAVFFVTFLAAFRGYFQGWQIMTPTAMSEVTEQFMRVVTMIFFAHLLLPQGLTYAAAGASMGAGVGAFCGLLVLCYYYRKLEKKFAEPQVLLAPPVAVDSAKTIIYRIIKLALPVSLSSLMLPVVSNLDMLIVPARLEVAGFSIGQATELFGYLTGMAVPLVNLATILTAAMTISIVPSIAESRVQGAQGEIRAKVRTAYRVSSLITIPSSVGLYVLAEKVATVIYNAPAAAEAIQITATGIFLLGLHQISTGVLQGLEHTTIPFVNMIIAAALKVILSYHLTALPELGIAGASWATVADIGCAALINLVFIYKYTGENLPFAGIGKALVASLIMGVGVHYFLSAAASWGEWNILGALIISVPLYFGVLIVLRGITAEDLGMIPTLGPKVIRLGQKVGLFK